MREKVGLGVARVGVEVKTEEARREMSRSQARWAESAQPESTLPGESSLSE